MEGDATGEGTGQNWQQPSGQGAQQGGAPPQQGGPPPQHGGGHGRQGYGQAPQGPMLSDQQKQNMISMAPMVLAIIGAVLAIASIVRYADFADVVDFEVHLYFWGLWATGLVVLGVGALDSEASVLSRVGTILLGFLALLASTGGVGIGVSGLI